MPWSDTDIAIAKSIEKTLRQLSADAQFVVVELLHKSYLKKTSVCLPPNLAQHVAEKLHAVKVASGWVAVTTPADEVMLAAIEKSFNELSPAAQENVAKVVTRKRLLDLFHHG